MLSLLCPYLNPYLTVLCSLSDVIVHCYDHCYDFTSEAVMILHLKSRGVINIVIS